MAAIPADECTDYLLSGALLDPSMESLDCLLKEKPKHLRSRLFFFAMWIWGVKTVSHSMRESLIRIRLDILCNRSYGHQPHINAFGVYCLSFLLCTASNVVSVPRTLLTLLILGLFSIYNLADCPLLWLPKVNHRPVF